MEIQSISSISRGTRKIPIYSLKSSILKSPKAIIAECKKASPSSGTIQSDYDPVFIAKSYEKCGAVAISVLTDEKFFAGSLSDLQLVSESVSIPVMRKDFIIDELQIVEAYNSGASAILLIVRILDNNQLKSLHHFARSLGLEVLVEVHTVAEAKLAVDIGAEIIGINSRDLDTLKIDLNMIPLIAECLPASIIKVGESGVANRSDLDNILKYTHAALIGTYFMKSSNIESAFQEL